MGGLFAKPGSEAPVPASLSSQRWELVSRPQGLVSLENFVLRDETIDTTGLKEGEAIVQCEVLSVDAFIRTMLDAEAYHGAVPLGGTGVCIRPSAQCCSTLD